MSSNAQSPGAEYRIRLAHYRAQRQSLDRSGLVLANVRLASFLGSLASAALAWAGRLDALGWWLAAGLAAVFVAAAIAHDRVIRRERRAAHRIAIAQRGLARLERRWEALASRGDLYLDPAHPYAADLDLFGPASLFQLVDATATAHGERTLARWLCAPADGPQTIAARQQAVGELAEAIELREAVEVEGRMLGGSKADASRLIAWAESAMVPAETAVLRLARVGLPLATLALFLLGRWDLIARSAFLWGVAAQAVLLLAVRKRTGAVVAAVAGPGERLADFGEVFRALQRAAVRAPALRGIQDRLRASGAAPSVEMGRLVRAASFLKMREQPLFHVPLNLLTLWDLHWCAAALDWHRRCGHRVRDWFEALSDFEALSSLGGFAFDNPDARFPALEQPGTAFVAAGLGHPLLTSQRRVVNDVQLDARTRALLVTGSNMAGKTTLLRTIGVNAVLAFAGAPTCAERLRLSIFQVRTSMRVRDSLAQGVSFFYAEVARLKGVLDAAARGPVLFLLDEVLQGTNTAERQLASRSIVKQLVDAGAIGAVATHDLGLTSLEAETAGRVCNVHFTDVIRDGEMTFDYRLRSGVVTTTNALRLLERAGIRVAPAEGSGGAQENQR